MGVGDLFRPSSVWTVFFFFFFFLFLFFFFLHLCSVCFSIMWPCAGIGIGFQSLDS